MSDTDSLQHELDEMRVEMQDSYSARVEKGLQRLLSYTANKLAILELMYARGIPIEATASRIVHQALTDSSMYFDDAQRYAGCDMDDYTRYMDSMVIRLIGAELRTLYCGQPITQLNAQKQLWRWQRMSCGCVNTICPRDTCMTSELE